MEEEFYENNRGLTIPLRMQRFHIRITPVFNNDSSLLFEMGRLNNPSDINASNMPFTSPDNKSKLKNDTTTLQNSAFYEITKMDSTSVHSKLRPAENLLKMLKKREYKTCVSSSFSSGEKCRLANNFIPNKSIPISSSKTTSIDGKLYCGIHSRDGNYFISCSQDKYIRIYDTKNGKFKLINTIVGRDVGWSILDAQFTPNNEHFVYSSWSPTIYLSSVNGDCDSQVAISLNPTVSRFCLFSLAVTSDNRLILGGSNDGHIYSYDLQADVQLLRIPAHNYDVNSIAFADPSSQLLYSGGDDGVINVWDIRTLSEPNPKPVGFLAGHVDGITFIDSRNDGRHLISNSKDQTIKLWDIRAFSTKTTQATCLNALHNMAWDYRWQEVPSLLYCANHKIEGDSSLMTYRGHVVVKTLIRCRFSPSFSTGQRYIYCGSGHGKAIIYDSLTGDIVRKLGRIQDCIRDISWHPQRPEIIASSWARGIVKWVHGSNISEDERNAAIVETRQTYSKLRRSQRIANMQKERLQQQQQQQNQQTQTQTQTQGDDDDDDESL